MAQPPPSRKSFAIVQALFRKFILRTALVCVPRTSRKEGMQELQAVRMTTLLATRFRGMGESMVLPLEQPLAAVGQPTGA